MIQDIGKGKMRIERFFFQLFIRGNYWRKMTTTTNPGNRAWFSMVSDGTDVITQ